MEKNETVTREPDDGPNKKQRLTSTAGSSSSTTPVPVVPEAPTEPRMTRFARMPVDTELEQLNRELSKRSHDERTNAGGEPEGDDETTEREKKRRIIGSVEGWKSAR